MSLVDAYTMVYDKCIEKPSKSEKMLNTFKYLLIAHLKSAIRSFSHPDKIKEFNYYHESYLIFAQILIKRVFSYLVDM